MDNVTDKNCSDMELALDAYLDLELSGEEAGIVERHLEVCPACALKLEQLQTLVDKLHGLPAPVLARDLADFIGDRILSQKMAPQIAEPSSQVLDMASARARSQERKNVFQMPRLFAVAAAFVLVAFAGTYFTGGLKPGVVTQVAQTQVKTPQANQAQAPLVASRPVATKAVVTAPVAQSPDVSNKLSQKPVVATAIKAVPVVASVPTATLKTVPVDVPVKATVGRADLANLSQSEDLIADFGDVATDGIYDFGITTNEDGLYAIKL